MAKIVAFAGHMGPIWVISVAGQVSDLAEVEEGGGSEDNSTCSIGGM